MEGRPKKDSESLEFRGAVKLGEGSELLSVCMGIGVLASVSMEWCCSLGVLYIVYNESSREGELDISDRFLFLLLEEEELLPTIHVVGLFMMVLFCIVIDEEVPGNYVGGKLSDLLFPTLSGTIVFGVSWGRGSGFYHSSLNNTSIGRVIKL